MGKNMVKAGKKEVGKMKKVRILLIFSVLAGMIGSPGISSLQAQGIGWPCPAAQIADMVEDLEVGDPLYYEDLTIIPVYNTRVTDHHRYTTLDQALRRKWITVTEVEGGQVPKLKVSNRSNRYIFIMGGEILTGCRQDRIVGRDVLLRPNARNVIIPVYCVEQGRWQYESKEFYSKSNLGTSHMRAEAQRAAPDAQQNIWSRVADSVAKNRINTGTSAYQDIYDSRKVKERLKQYGRKLGRLPYLSPDTVGAVIAVAGEIVSADIFANPDLFKKLWPKILKSAALAAEENICYGTIDQYQAIEFLHKVHDKQYIRRKAVDLGFELSAVDHEINANALVFKNAVMHLAVFRLNRGRVDRYEFPDLERRMPVIKRSY